MKEEKWGDYPWGVSIGKKRPHCAELLVSLRPLHVAEANTGPRRCALPITLDFPLQHKLYQRNLRQ